jgi:hypothetical protein
VFTSTVNFKIQKACLSLLDPPKLRSNVPVPSNNKRSAEPFTSSPLKFESKAISDAWFSFKQFFPAHRSGVGKIKVKEGETMFMKMYSKKEHNLKSRQYLFVWHYLLLGCTSCLIISSDLFLFDIVSLVTVCISVGVLNRVFHKKHTPYVLEVVLMPDDMVRVRTLTSYGGSRWRVLPTEDCNFGDLEHFTRIDGKEFKVLYSKCLTFIDESELRMYDLHEKAVRHRKYISPFADIDQVESSRNLFQKDKETPELLQDDKFKFVKVDSDHLTVDSEPKSKVANENS